MAREKRQGSAHLVDTSASVDPNAFVVPVGKAFMTEQIFMARSEEMVTGSNGADLSAYGALDTCCTSTLIGDETETYLGSFDFP